jgi:chromosome segregation ATPase
MSTLTLAQATTTVQQGGGGDGVTEGDLLAVIVAIVLGVLTLVGVIIQQAHSVKTSYREQTKSVEDRLSKMIEGVENGVTRLNNDLKEESRALGDKIDDQAERSRQRDEGLREAITDLRDRVEEVRREMSVLRMPARQEPGREEFGALHGPLERIATATGRIERRINTLEEDMEALKDEARRSQRQMNRRLRALEETAGEEGTQAAGPGPGEMRPDAGPPPR